MYFSLGEWGSGGSCKDHRRSALILRQIVDGLVLSVYQARMAKFIAYVRRLFRETVDEPYDNTW